MSPFERMVRITMYLCYKSAENNTLLLFASSMFCGCCIDLAFIPSSSYCDLRSSFLNLYTQKEIH